MPPPPTVLRRSLVLGLILVSAGHLPAADAVLAPPPGPQGMLTPGPKTDAPYVPLPLVPGGQVIPLYPPDSPYLKADKIREPEEYHSYSPGSLGYIIHIHTSDTCFPPCFPLYLA